MLSKFNPTAVLVAVVVVFVATLGGLLGLYALAPTKPPVGPLFGAIPGGLAFVGTAVVAIVQRGHTAQLTTIGKNTNGVLTQRITDAVNSAVPVAVATALASNAAPLVIPARGLPLAPAGTVPSQAPAPAAEQLPPRQPADQPLPAPADGGPA